MYKLINKQGESHLCDKVIIDGFDYYVSDEIIKDVRPHHGKWQVEEGTVLNKFPTYLTDLSSCRLVIATNNPTIDCPKVVDEVERLADEITPLRIGKERFKEGYNKAKETYSNTDEDMIEFGDWCENLQKNNKEIRRNNPDISRKELLQIFKQQKPKIIWYE